MFGHRRFFEWRVTSEYMSNTSDLLPCHRRVLLQQHYSRHYGAAERSKTPDWLFVFRSKEDLIALIIEVTTRSLLNFRFQILNFKSFNMQFVLYFYFVMFERVPCGVHFPKWPPHTMAGRQNGGHFGKWTPLTVT